MSPSPAIPAPGTHPRLQWFKRGSPAITLTEALDTAIPVDVRDDTVVDADAFYHAETDTLIVVECETVQTVLKRDATPLRCPHNRDPNRCPTCRAPDATPGGDGEVGADACE